MVWGMNLPPGSNGFYLEGDFEGAAGVASNGWRTRLAQHFQNELPESQRAIFEDEHSNGAHWYACHVVEKFCARIDRGRLPDASVASIEEHEAPAFYKATSSCNNLASLASFSGILTVDEPLKNFIEWMEPDTHRFFPIEIRKSRGKSPDILRYILVIRQWIDSFSREKSDKGSFNHHSGWFFHSEGPQQMRRLAFRKSDFGSAHLWRETSFYTPLVCFSDRFQAEFADAGLGIPRHYRMMEV
jgi:hypothetical protein